MSIDGQRRDPGQYTLRCISEGPHKTKILIERPNANPYVAVIDSQLHVLALDLSDHENNSLHWNNGNPNGTITAQQNGKSYTISGTMTQHDASTPQGSNVSVELQVTCP
ncbi:lipoprotein LpqH [Trueperella sp. LYQ143]|uniref:lipoprotein LpqH n=1 Tax=Trueperella sp. LYQ143 TaxID=3391059 RepID=UPI003983B79D